jgi:amino acid transporter
VNLDQKTGNRNRKAGSSDPKIVSRGGSSARKLRLLPLVAATYFMVSGGPYGLEDIVGQAGYGRALLLLAVLPLVWALPTALMVGELASAIPADGGFYVWVTRALGPFWGFQEAWLSLAASVFDMALYPTLFVSYLRMLAPSLAAGHRGLAWEAGVVLVCVGWNLLGAYDVGEGARWMCALFLTPFAVLVVAGVWRGIEHGLSYSAAGGGQWGRVAGGSMSTAVLVAMWNYMGWDNASTVAGEVERPQRTYLRAMLGAVVLVTASYLLPVLAAAVAGISAAQFATGAWVDAARTISGEWLAVLLTAGGALTGVAMFNALTLSYARLPFAMAEEGWLPRAFSKTNRRGAPWVCVLALATVWLLALGLSFERLIEVDVTLYGASLVLEFVALVVLRVRAPGLARPFRVPGGSLGAVVLGVAPTALIIYAVVSSRGEQLAGHSALLWCAGIAALGPVVYGVARASRARFMR